MSVPPITGAPIQMNNYSAGMPSDYMGNIEDPNATPFSDGIVNQALNAPPPGMPKVENNLWPNLLMGAAAAYGGVKVIQRLTNGGKVNVDKESLLTKGVKKVGDLFKSKAEKKRERSKNRIKIGIVSSIIGLLKKAVGKI